MTLIFATEKCGRCDGTGTMPYRHVNKGRCMRCHGRRTQISRAGSAAQRAFDAAVTERTAIPAGAVTVGMVLASTSPKGEPWTVERIESGVSDGGAEWFRYFTTTPRGGTESSGLYADQVARRHMPDVVAEIEREIVARYKGARLA